jgi:DNA-binding NarL/FixJ family response regulator
MKILIADDHPFTLFGTKGFLESLGYNISHICSNGITAYNFIKMHRPDIAILDINMPGIDGLEVAKKIHEELISTKVILLTMHNEISIYKKALEYGIYGYLLKNFSTEELDICLESVINNKHYVSPHLEEELTISHFSNQNTQLSELTLAERKIVELVAQQKSSKQIAELLFIAEKTVENHRRKIIEKLGLPKEKNTLLTWALKNIKT